MDQSFRGQFLIAGRRLCDPNFFKTVVLVIEHNADGAMGLVVNRPSTISVANALSHQFDMADCEEVLHHGGPVDPTALFVLHNSRELSSCECPVAPGVFAGHSSDVFEQVITGAQNEQPGLQFRVYCGCAGWGEGQLEGEIERGDWFMLPATSEATFNEDPYGIWDGCLAEVLRSNRLIPQMVTNPEWN